jgi:hypothetical protein
MNKLYPYKNQFYLQGPFSSPMTTPFEYYQGAKKFLAAGDRIKQGLSIKNLDGSYANTDSKGVFPEPGDNALLGRGTADVIVKENEVLIRAGKFQGTNLEPNIIPAGSSKRGFLQLSRFNTTKYKKPDKILSQFDEIVVSVKYLIEWIIVNPENTQNKLSGNVYLYQLKPDLSTNSENLTVGSEVKENLKSLVASESFSLLSKAETIAFINNFIQTCNSKSTTTANTTTTTSIRKIKSTTIL